MFQIGFLLKDVSDKCIMNIDWKGTQFCTKKDVRRRKGKEEVLLKNSFEIRCCGFAGLLCF